MHTILVTGDFLVDHHIYEGRRHHFGDQMSRGVCVKEELGGAALIHRLLEEIQSQSSTQWRSALAVDADAALLSSQSCRAGGDACVDQPFAAYAFWRPFPAAPKSKTSCWRVAEAMGYGGGPATLGLWPWMTADNLPSEPDMLVISDGGMGFRSRMNLAHWRAPIHDPRSSSCSRKLKPRANRKNNCLSLPSRGGLC